MLKERTGNVSWWYSQCAKANGATISLSLPLKASQDVSSIMKGLRVGVVTTPTGFPETLIFEAFVRFVKHVFMGSPDSVTKTKCSNVIGDIHNDHCFINVQVKDNASAERVCTKLLLKCLDTTKLKLWYKLAVQHYSTAVGVKLNDADFDYAVNQMNSAIAGALTIGIIGTKKLSAEQFHDVATKAFAEYRPPVKNPGTRATPVQATQYPECPIAKKDGWKMTVARSFISTAAKTNVYPSDRGLILINKKEYDPSKNKRAAEVYAERFLKHPERKCAYVYVAVNQGFMSSVEAHELLSKSVSSSDMISAVQ